MDFQIIKSNDTQKSNICFNFMFGNNIHSYYTIFYYNSNGNNIHNSDESKKLITSWSLDE
jgi:hypothetical protein